MADSNARRIASNSLTVSLTTYGALVAKVFVNIYFYRRIAVELVDTYQAVFAFVNLFAVIGELGLDSVLVRELARAAPHDRGRLLFNGALCRVFLAALSVGVCCAGVWLADLPPETSRLAWFFSFSILLGAWPVFQAPFRAELTNVIPLILASAVVLLSLAAKAALVWMSSTLFMFFAAATACEALKCVLLWGYYRAKSPVRMDTRVDVDMLLRLFRVAVPVALISLASYVNLRVDQVMIAGLRAATGHLANYSVAVMLVEISQVIMTSFAAVSMPLMARHAAQEPERFRFLVERLHKYTAVLLMPALFFMMYFPSQILFYLFGNKYSVAIAVLPWLTVAMMFSVFCNLLFQVGFALRRETLFLPVFVGGGALNIALNLYWIPKVGVLGAGYATVASYAFNLLACLAIPEFRGYVVCALRMSVVPGLLAFALVAPIHVWNLPDGLLLLSATVYLPLLYLIRHLDREDMAVVRAIMSRG